MEMQKNHGNCNRYIDWKNVKLFLLVLPWPVEDDGQKGNEQVLKQTIIVAAIKESTKNSVTRGHNMRRMFIDPLSKASETSCSSRSSILFDSLGVEGTRTKQ